MTPAPEPVVLTRRCAAPPCTGQVNPDMLMCLRHWYQVPKPVRAAVWRAWAGGAGAGTPAHRAAVAAAVRAVHCDV